MITYQSSPSTWASSQGLAHFGLEMIFFNWIKGKAVGLENLDGGDKVQT